MAEDVPNVQVGASQKLGEDRQAAEGAPEALRLVGSFRALLFDELAYAEVLAEGDAAGNPHEFAEEPLGELVELSVCPQVVRLVDQRARIGVEDRDATAAVMGVASRKVDVFDRLKAPSIQQRIADCVSVFREPGKCLEESARHIPKLQFQASHERVGQACRPAAELPLQFGLRTLPFLFGEQVGKGGGNRVVRRRNLGDHMRCRAARNEVGLVL